MVHDSIKHDLKLDSIVCVYSVCLNRKKGLRGIVCGRITYLFTLVNCVFTFDDICPPSMVEPVAVADLVAVETLFPSAVLKNII